MKRQTFLIGLLMFWGALGIADTTSIYDFRQTTWGMSKEQVKRIERGSPTYYEDAATVMYEGQVAGLNCVIAYMFVDERLYQSTYIIVEKHVNKNLYIDDYNKLNQIMADKYGKPILDGHHWSDDLYKDAPSDWGHAISIGHLTLRAIWETPRSHITLALFGDNFKINLAVVYDSRELKALKKKKDTESESKDF